MMNLGDRVWWGTVTAEPIMAHGFSIALQSWSLAIRLPWGGFVWNRPVAVIVDEHKQIPVVDVTRRMQIALLAVVALCAALSGQFRCPAQKQFFRSR